MDGGRIDFLQSPSASSPEVRIQEEARPRPMVPAASQNVGLDERSARGSVRYFRTFQASAHGAGADRLVSRPDNSGDRTQSPTSPGNRRATRPDPRLRTDQRSKHREGETTRGRDAPRI